MGKIKEILKRKYLVKRADGDYDQYKHETDADLVSLQNGITLDKTNCTEVIALKLSGGNDIVTGTVLRPIPFLEVYNNRSSLETSYAKAVEGKIYAKKEGWYTVDLIVSVTDGGQQPGDWNTAILSDKNGVSRAEYENYNQGGNKMMKAAAGGLIYLKNGDYVYGYIKNPQYAANASYRVDGKESKLVFSPYCLYE